MAGKSVAGRLKIGKDEGLDIGGIPALLTELGLDGMAQEAAVVVFRCRLLCLQDGRQKSRQDDKQKPHSTNVGRKRKTPAYINS